MTQDSPQLRQDEGHRSSRVTLILLWLALVVVLAVVLYLAFRACGIRLPLIGQLDWCKPVTFSHAPDDRSLERELARLQRQLNSVRQCPAEAGPPPPAPDPGESGQAELGPCPEPRDRRVVLVTDVSTSMDSSINLPAALERRYNQALAANNAILARVLRMQVDAVPGPSRIAIAREAMTRLAEDANADIAFDFYTFAQCGAPAYRGHFERGERQPMIGEIQGIELGPATALADAIDGVTQSLADEGGPAANEDINIVLLSDGMDTCNGDPCAAARRLNSRYPGIPVNVVALSRNIGAVQCVAEATGGAFYPATEAGNVVQSIRRAAEQTVPDHCRDPAADPEEAES